MIDGFPKGEPGMKQERQHSPEEKEAIGLVHKAEALLIDGDEEGSTREAEIAWEKAMHVLDAETIGKEFATAGVLDILVAKIDALPLEKRLAIAEAVLAHGGLETIFLKNWDKFPGIDQRKIVVRAINRKAGFHLIKYADKITDLRRREIAGLLIQVNDKRGADAWIDLAEKEEQT